MIIRSSGRKFLTKSGGAFCEIFPTSKCLAFCAPIFPLGRLRADTRFWRVRRSVPARVAPNPRCMGCAPHFLCLAKENAPRPVEKKTPGDQLAREAQVGAIRESYSPGIQLLLADRTAQRAVFAEIGWYALTVEPRPHTCCSPLLPHIGTRRGLPLRR